MIINKDFLIGLIELNYKLMINQKEHITLFKQ